MNGLWLASLMVSTIASAWHDRGDGLLPFVGVTQSQVESVLGEPQDGGRGGILGGSVYWYCWRDSFGGQTCCLMLFDGFGQLTRVKPEYRPFVTPSLFLNGHQQPAGTIEK